jgi:hypothetical protein
VRLSANAKTDIADYLCVEAFFLFSQDVELGDLFDIVVQGRRTPRCWSEQQSFHRTLPGKSSRALASQASLLTLT